MQEQDLLIGPNAIVSFLSMVNVEDKVTGRILTYSLDSERSSKVVLRMLSLLVSVDVIQYLDVSSSFLSIHLTTVYTC